MKKALWILLPLLVIVTCIYIFIPGTVRIRQETSFTVNAKAFTRKFPEQQNWPAWWPGDSNSKQAYRFNKNIYQVAENRLTSLRINIQQNAGSVASELFFIPMNDSTIRLQWGVVVPTSSSPFQRVKRFLNAEDLQRDMAQILERVRVHYSQPTTLYGLTIEKGRVKDSSLISITTTTPGYPTVKEVYAMIEKLQAHASAQGARQTALPMLNVSNEDGSSYRLQAAIPVDRKLPDAGDIKYKWMLGGGNILMAEVKGGPYTINTGFQSMAAYVEDHRRQAPAIPFQSLVTDRRTEPDTAKWVTKLYWPVM